MLRTFSWLVTTTLRLGAVVSLGAVLTATELLNAQPLHYPPTTKGDVVDDYHGTKIADPYRWLEDLNSADTKAWIDAQNAATLPWLESLPQRAALQKRLTELWNYPRTGLPIREAGQLFYRHNSGLQKQAPLYRRASLTARSQLLIDPNTLSADGSISLANWRPSPDGRYIAYGLSEGGADWAEVHVREIATGKDLPDVVRWFRFSGISWTKDGKGFFYARFPEPPRARRWKRTFAIISSGITVSGLRRIRTASSTGVANCRATSSAVASRKMAAT